MISDFIFIASDDVATVTTDDDALFVGSPDKETVKDDSLDSLVDELKQEFGINESEFVSARQELAETFYPDGKNLAALRMRAGLSQRGLAKAADTTQSYIARLENGENNPGLTKMRKLCAALNVDMNTLNEALS